MQRILNSIFFFVLVLQLGAQDAHLTHAASNMSLANPALQTTQNQEIALFGNHRTQWAAIAPAFRTYRFGFEKNNKAFTWGASLVNLDAGEASLKQKVAQVKLNYRKQLSEEGNALFAGLGLGVIHQSFDPSVFRYDSQYQAGIGFNENISNGETFEFTNQIIPSLSVGIVYRQYIGRSQNNLGLSWSNLNQTNASFYNYSNYVHPRRFSIFIQSNFPMNSKYNLRTNIQYQQQATAKAVVAQAGVQYKMDKQKSWYLDLGNRFEDAVLVSTGFQFNHTIIGMSYDWQYSKLGTATRRNGALEINLAHTISPKTKKPKVEEKIVVEPSPSPVPQVQYSDKDGDGIEDSVDACPNLFGEKSNRGCPTSIKDSDGDGLLDDSDACPFLKGSSRHQGCPDTDKDGIADPTDSCPFLKGVASNFGCPLQDVEEVKSRPKVHIEFDTDQSYIKTQYWSELDELVQFLEENRNAQIFISGHTDTEGNAAYNFDLGERRCQAVVAYLLERGITSTQITTVSYGETKPVNSNNTVYGKARNRRVEVVIVL